MSFFYFSPSKLFKVLATLTFLSNTVAEGQIKKETGPLVKVIRATNSPDSNTVFVTYDKSFRLNALTEYVKNSKGWVEIKKVNYLRNKDGYVYEIKWDGIANQSENILQGGYTGKVEFLFDSLNKMIGKRESIKPDIFIKYDYNKDGLIIRELIVDNQSQKIKMYLEYMYDEFGRAISYDGYSVNNFRSKRIITKNLLPEKDFNKPRYNSIAEPFLINNQNLILFYPFKHVVTAYFNNYPRNGNRHEFNSAGFPSLSTVADKDGNVQIEYQYLYVEPSSDFTWQQYLATKHTDKFFKKATLSNVAFIEPLTYLRKHPTTTGEPYQPIDLRNGLPPEPNELLRNEKSYVSEHGSGSLKPLELSAARFPSYLIDMKRGKPGSSEINLFVQIYSINKTNFRVENYSRYPFLVHISGYKDIFLVSQTGATCLKETVNDSSKISIEFPDSSFVIRHKLFLSEINKYGGNVDILSSSIDFSLKAFLNRERLPSPTIVWKNEYGETTKVEGADPLNDEIDRQLYNIIGIGLAASSKIELEKNRKDLESKLTENQLIYKASQGIDNEYRYYFLYLPLKEYIDRKFKQIK